LFAVNRRLFTVPGRSLAICRRFGSVLLGPAASLFARFRQGSAGATAGRLRKQERLFTELGRAVAGLGCDISQVGRPVASSGGFVGLGRLRAVCCRMLRFRHRSSTIRHRSSAIRRCFSAITTRAVPIGCCAASCFLARSQEILEGCLFGGQEGFLLVLRCLVAHVSFMVSRTGLDVPQLCGLVTR
jgi:hypothetical protein